MEILVDVVDVLLTWNRCFLICLNPDSFGTRERLFARLWTIARVSLGGVSGALCG